MYLCYLDDSCEDASHQVIGAVVIPDSEFMIVEEYLGYLVEQHVPEELRSSFEFHASELFHGKPPFDKIDRDTALGILEGCAAMIAEVPIPVVYGAVDLRKLRAGKYATASPIDVAFRLCIPEINRWFEQKGVTSQDFGVLIADNTKNQHHKAQLQQAFRANRKPARPKATREEVNASRGRLSRLHDDMYFGDSGYSVGIQLADICCFIILRHLQGKEDTEFLYKQIEGQIFSARVAPNEKP